MRSRTAAIAVLAAPALLLAGCAAPGADGDERLTVVASTSVYGDIAATVAGDDAEVTSIITSIAQDPHSYEVTARDRLAIDRADLVVYNGGGYDGFVEAVLAAMDEAPVAISAAELAGVEGHHHDHEHDGDHDDGDAPGHAEHDHAEDAHAPDHAEDAHDDHPHENEHVWYDLHVMVDLAAEIAHRLGELDPDHASDYEANAAAFASELAPVDAHLHSLADRADGLGVVITEPVPGYLLAGAGLEDLTPEGFSEAIEEGSDVPPALLAEVLDVLASGRVALVADTPQTSSTETERVVATARDAGIPVVAFTETLPDGEDFVSWMAANVAAIEAALP